MSLKRVFRKRADGKNDKQVINIFKISDSQNSLLKY